MKYTFAQLERLLETRPKDYQLEIERMHLQDPERFERWVAHITRIVNRDHKAHGERLRRHASMRRFILGT